jgi:hypothetical protein
MGLASALTGQAPQPDQSLGFVQISAIESNRSELSCAAEETARVTAQIWFIGIPDLTTNPKIITVGLYESWSLPVGIKLRIDQIRKNVQLKRSPAVVEFELRCSKESHPGEIAFTAHIDEAPKGVDIKRPDPPEKGTIKLQIK